jgi:hypothetical protein
MEGILFLLFIGAIQVLGAWIKKKQEAKKLAEEQGDNRSASPPTLAGSESAPPPVLDDPIKAFLETLTGEAFNTPKPDSKPLAYDDADYHPDDSEPLAEDEFQNHSEEPKPVYHDEKSKNFVSEISDFKEEDIVLGAATDQDWSQDGQGADPFLKEVDANAKPLAVFQKNPDRTTLKSAIVWKFILDDCKAKQRQKSRR